MIYFEGQPLGHLKEYSAWL